MVKMTFTFDDVTVRKLRQVAARLKKPQSEVVRNSIQSYAGVRTSWAMKNSAACRRCLIEWPHGRFHAAFPLPSAKPTACIKVGGFGIGIASAPALAEPPW